MTTFWPWPQADVDYALSRAVRSLADDGREPRDQQMLARAFLISLTLPAANREPIRDLRTYISKKSLSKLHDLIEQATASQINPPRGDIVYVRSRPRARVPWYGLRTH